jgi:hypothetical protein
MKLGARQALDTEEWDRARSGWDVERIQKWVEDRGDCRKPEWVQGYH